MRGFLLFILIFISEVGFSQTYIEFKSDSDMKFYKNIVITADSSINLKNDSIKTIIYFLGKQEYDYFVKLILDGVTLEGSIENKDFFSLQSYIVYYKDINGNTLKPFWLVLHNMDEVILFCKNVKSNIFKIPNMGNLIKALDMIYQQAYEISFVK